MPKNKKWWPGTRAGQLEMADKWMALLTSSNAQKWNIKQDDIDKFCKAVDKAKNALFEVQNAETHTPIAVERCKVAFKELEAAARLFKRMYLTMPPLDSADLVSFGLNVPDRKPTHHGTPSAQVAIETFLEGKYELGVKFVFISGNPNDPANNGFRVYYSVVGHGEEKPKDQEDLRKSFFTRRKKTTIRFNPSDAGKTCYIAAQIENNSLKGPWGPMTSAVIP